MIDFTKKELPGDYKNMSELSFNGQPIKHILDSIRINQPRDYATDTFIANPSSNNVTFLSTEGKTVTFTSLVEANDNKTLKVYRDLAKKFTNKSGVLVSTTDLGINGNYYLVNYSEDKKVNGSYHISWEFLEYLRPNKVEKTFKRIGRSATKKKTQKVTKKTSRSYITILLTDCRTLKYGLTGNKCVKYLQKFLQKKGYYKGYKIDGDYLKYTQKAVKQLQRAYKIKATGAWDTRTRDYWRKKYNIKR